MWAKDFLELSKYQLNKRALESLRCWSEENFLPSSFSHYVPSLIPWVDKKQRFACEVVPIGLGSRIRFPVRWRSKLSWTKKDVFPLGVVSLGRYQARQAERDQDIFQVKLSWAKKMSFVWELLLWVDIKRSIACVKTQRRRSPARFKLATTATPLFRLFSWLQIQACLHSVQHYLLFRLFNTRLCASDCLKISRLKLALLSQPVPAGIRIVIQVWASSVKCAFFLQKPSGKKALLESWRRWQSTNVPTAHLLKE